MVPTQNNKEKITSDTPISKSSYYRSLLLNYSPWTEILVAGTLAALFYLAKLPEDLLFTLISPLGLRVILICIPFGPFCPSLAPLAEAILVALIGVFIYRFLGRPHSVSIPLSATVPLAAGILPLLNVYLDSSWFLPVLIVLIFIISYLVMHFLYNRLSIPGQWAVPIITLLSIGFLISVQSKTAEVDKDNFAKKELADIESTYQKAENGIGGFYFYVPDFVPEGYKSVAFSLDNSREDQTRHYFFVLYEYLNNTTHDSFSIEIRSFAKPSFYNPPADCTSDRPALPDNFEHVPFKCLFVTKLVDGTEVYRDGDAYFLLLGNTLVTIDGNGVYFPDSPLSYEDFIKMMNSLKKRTPTELKQLETTIVPL